MRAAELLGRPVRDSEGTHCGVVLDIRLVAVADSGDPGSWEVDGIVVGPRRSLARAGYAYGTLTRPWPLAITFRALARSLRFVPWEAVEADDATSVQGKAEADYSPRALALRCPRRVLDHPRKAS
jgi:hypothetical protein